MIRFPDPRNFAPGAADNRLLHLAGNPQREQELSDTLRSLLETRADGGIREALRLAPCRDIYVRLWDALCATMDERPAAADDLVTRVFALPCVIVCRARRKAVIPGVLPDIGAIAGTLEKHGAFGPSRNVGIANALCSSGYLEGLAPSTIYHWTHATSGGTPREIAPQDIVLRGGEEVHLRFLVGAGIAPAHAPSVVETAANIAAWGLPLTRALAAQLATSGVELLPVPRAPASLLRAPHAGRRAQLELAFNLFVGNAARRFRTVVGDPVAVIAAHENGEIRVGFSSLLDDTLHELYRWPLHPLDDLDSVLGSIRGLLEDCRIGDVRVIDRVMPDLDRNGLPLV
ncbi:MAG: hypothetical protein HYY79_05965, partial [Betaproteobacteria bacterium]|nr:hypothetical protein [Betaproteobacteria bacterium]